MLLNAGYVALTIIAVSMLILIHEFGHFVCAKAVGMRVEVFSIGFWKRLVGFRLGDTDYRISLIPLGGYVKVTGESPEEGAGQPYEFWSKTPGQRALFIVGGVSMNIIMALVLFIVAFAIGVPFGSPTIGQVEPGSPAWKAGIQPGDKVVRVNDLRNPVFEEISRAIILGNKTVSLEVDRHGQLMTFDVEPSYDPVLGIRTIGILAQAQPVVTGLAKLDWAGGISPAQEGGVELGDRILAINGVPVETGGDINRRLLDYPDEDVKLLVQRDGRDLTLTVHTQPPKDYLLGISAVGTTVTGLQPGGPASAAGLKSGDTITAVDGRSVLSSIGMLDIMMQQARAVRAPAEPSSKATPSEGGRTFTLDVDRGSGHTSVTVKVADAAAVRAFVDSMDFASSTTLTWVQPGSPAYKAGMRPGDKILTVADKPIAKWSEVLSAGAAAGKDARQVEWSRDGRTFSANLTPALMDSGGGGVIGISMDWPVMVPRQYGALGAIRHGLQNSWNTLTDFLATVHGIATHSVSSRMLGGIVTIVRVTHRAAEFGLGKLLYITAFLSASIAFLNVLPIPILDGGHLLFLAIEKLRGRRVSEKAMAISQTIGGVLLLALVVYVTRNDIVNWIGMR